MREKILTVFLLGLFIFVMVLFTTEEQSRQQSAAAADPAPTAIPETISTCAPPPVSCMTMTISNPVKTITITPPGGTITVPGPGNTITKTLPRHTITRTLRPPTVTRSVIRTRTPPPITATVRTTHRATETVFRERPTVTETSSGGQTTVTSATIVPTTRIIHLPGKDITTVQLKKVGVGLLTLIIIVACILGSMYYGWRLGRNVGIHKHAEDDVKFIQSLKSNFVTRGKHR